MAAIAVVENCASLVGASELQLCISNLFGAALGARLNRLGHGVDVVLLDGLNRAVQFLAEHRREIGRFGRSRDLIGPDI